MRFVKVLFIIIVVIFLTVLTQIGGIVFVISILVNAYGTKYFTSGWAKLAVKFSSFLVLYLLSVFIIVPLMAKPFGRVPLPLFRTNNLKPGTMLTFLMNRNYVRPPIREVVFEVAEKMGRVYPGTTLNYLDASFPFFNGFPLFPHLSHNDGKKLDISFMYNNTVTHEKTDKIPSWMGYGICEDPKPNEENTTEFCSKRGYWQYDLLSKAVSQKEKKKFEFDQSRTKKLIQFFADHKMVGLIFLEPHLKTRLGLVSHKLVFHGCQAVRHDDHFHVQLN